MGDLIVCYKDDDDVVEVGRIPYSDYSKEAFMAKAGHVTIPIEEKHAHAIQDKDIIIVC